VVDDAIVMTENIYNRIEKGMTPLQAGIDGSREILFAIISTSITLLCVFVPIVFMQGQTGRLFREFAFEQFLPPARRPASRGLRNVLFHVSSLARPA